MAIDVFDVAIVGAGMSGLWSGNRLLGEAGPSGAKRSAVILEWSDRVGGRLLSVRMPGRPDVTCELGGMRFTEDQPLIAGLIKTLKLETQAMPVYEATNIAYLRGQRLTLADLGDASKVPFFLEADEKLRIKSLLSDAIAAIAPSTVGKVGAELRKAVETAEYNGVPLWQLGFWNALATEMSGEAFRFTQQSGGYDTTQLNWNAAETIVLNSDFRSNVQFNRLPNGYDQVPTLLAKQFEANGGEIWTRHRVKSLEPAKLPSGANGVKLVVEDLRDGGTTTVLAGSVILAMPRRSLELLDPSGPIMGDRTFQELIRSVTPIPLFKSFLAYHRPWWLEAGVANDGRTVTDLPLRQTYYWMTGDATTPNSIVLATYDDTDDVGFWQGYAVSAPRYGLQTAHLPADAAAAVTADSTDDTWKQYQAPAAMVTELHRELEIVHGISDAPPPYAAIYHDWIDDPYGGGVNFWNVGVKAWEVSAQIANPVKGIPVYVAGEAYSRNQGWVEGALETAEVVLTTYFGLPPAGATSQEA